MAAAAAAAAAALASPSTRGRCTVQSTRVYTSHLSSVRKIKARKGSAQVEPIKITSVEIPSIVRAGTDESIILDCKYDMESSSNAALVVKWYVNQELIYQWIHGSKPKGSDEFQQYIDETYKASSDPNTMYRAVKLVRPGHELSGKVRCSISSQDDETDAEKHMLVYSTEKVFRLSHPTTNGDSTQLTTTCLAEDLYPLPNVTLHRDNQLISEQKQYYKNKTDGRFSVEVEANLPTEHLKLPTTFRCEITIEEANYTSRDPLPVFHTCFFSLLSSWQLQVDQQ
ncbi:hypothetical protein PV328_010702 [Microctonus aethiopoides]|uniref:Ig-like domain-containing protein n=1 Tax=Microctonus aethiopoides TaxID=144406 RepID=A0AA39FIB0_9HYME|nr:hypothetical protein PV328_010702 [Microctonus aethiopoides]